MKVLRWSLLAMFMASVAQANSYKCAKMIYKDGWFRKYDVKGNTWGANTKKQGITSSSAGSTTETSTASVDPGVSTNRLLSSAQYSSSWGECAAVDMEITKEFRSQYLKQNMAEIKKQIMIGHGYHLDSLAVLSGCHGLDRDQWVASLRKDAAKFYDAKDEAAIERVLFDVISVEPALLSSCKLVG